MNDIVWILINQYVLPPLQVIKLIKPFSISYAISCFFDIFYHLNKIGLGRVWLFFNQRKSRYIYNYIDSNYKDIIQDYKSIDTLKKETADITIWFFWAQSIEAAPDIVRICNNSLHKTNAGNVVNIDMSNYSDYVDIPDYVINKVRNGGISLTLFSDILRVSLLAKYGGIWVDATCFVTDRLSTLIKENSIFTLASKKQQNPRFISNNKWVIYTIGTDQINSILFSLCRDILFEFWRTNNIIIDYFFTDHIVNYVYTNFKVVESMMNNGAIDGSNRASLYRCLNKKYDRIDFDNVVNQSKVFKLTYKSKLIEYDKSGELTIYSKLKELYL